MPPSTPPDPNKDKYESNKKHHKNSDSPEPKNAKEMFNRSRADPDSPLKRWYKDDKGNIHRFTGDKNGQWHWNGSSGGRNGGSSGDKIKPDNIPNSIQKLPKGDLPWILQ